ncbi:alpha/beta hydrolase family protein [Acidiluteibacter ferrifornacis]|uniref:Prolyl oligopeptidase family serine peptidase n=1 Tax=Acidiluteibacter ferrifornacis TaxID=2692424 RepID=A0A6N9NP01_9FLAO|nr:alpha/beta fold hydrolase [Acidiluteibacter ferrifornacis]NBG67000.1 prolyl oligopeptidase family serine peptidase [Acidiluteibacter ferrifornacis]
MSSQNSYLSSNVVINGSRDRSILIDIRKPKKVARGTILFLHGFKGFKDWGTFNLISDYFANMGYTFVKFNFSYNGGTIEHPIDFPDEQAFGENNYSTELNDLSLVIDFLEKENWIEHSLTLIGHSRGGGIAILGAAEDERVNKLVTLAAVSDFSNRMPDYKAIKTWELTGVRYILNGRTKQNLPMFFQFYQDFEKNKNRLDIQRAVRQIEIPFLIIHGELDETVKVDEAMQLKENCSQAKLEIIPNANHTFNGYHPYDINQLPKETEIAVNTILKFLESID